MSPGDNAFSSARQAWATAKAKAAHRRAEDRLLNEEIKAKAKAKAKGTGRGSGSTEGPKAKARATSKATPKATAKANGTASEEEALAVEFEGFFDRLNVDEEEAAEEEEKPADEPAAAATAKGKAKAKSKAKATAAKAKGKAKAKANGTAAEEEAPTAATAAKAKGKAKAKAGTVISAVVALLEPSALLAARAAKAKAKGNGKGKANGTETAVGDAAPAESRVADTSALVTTEPSEPDQLGNDEHRVYCKDCKAWVSYQRCRVLSKTAGTCEPKVICICRSLVWHSSSWMHRSCVARHRLCRGRVIYTGIGLSVRSLFLFVGLGRGGINLIYWGESSPLRLSLRVQLWGSSFADLPPPCIAGTWRCCKCSTKCTQLRRIFNHWPTPEFMQLSEDTCTSSNSVDTNQKPTAIRSLASATSVVLAV